MLLNFLVMGQNKEYYAFISYKREDKKEAKWLQHALEYYRLPNQLRQHDSKLPEYVRPIFREMYQLFQEIKSLNLPNVEMEILRVANPEITDGDNGNEASMVFKLTAKDVNKSMIFLGDAYT